MGRPAWSLRSRFSTFLARKRNEDELDRLVSDWTSDLEPQQAMHLLQGHGVPAGAVQDAARPHQRPTAPAPPPFPRPASPRDRAVPNGLASVSLRGRATDSRPLAPCLGQDNEAIFRDLLGIEGMEYERLEREGVFE